MKLLRQHLYCKVQNNIELTYICIKPSYKAQSGMCFFCLGIEGFISNEEVFPMISHRFYVQMENGMPSTMLWKLIFKSFLKDIKWSSFVYLSGSWNEYVLDWVNYGNQLNPDIPGLQLVCCRNVLTAKSGSLPAKYKLQYHTTNKIRSIRWVLLMVR